MNISWFDNVIINPHLYVEEILKNPFADVEAGPQIFKGIQVRGQDELSEVILSLFPDYKTAYSFVRQSPVGQKEPNFIHTDEMMGDKTVILYLNKTYPPEAGTTLYDNNIPMCRIFAKFNRMTVFDSVIPHSRNIFENFGIGNHARLAQVMFIKKNV